MERFHQAIRRVCVRPFGQTVCIALCGFALLMWTLMNPTPVLFNFIVYNIATYALVICITMGVRLRGAVRRSWGIQQVEERLRSTALGARALEDREFRGWIPVYLSIVWHLAYALVKLIAGRWLGSIWLTTLGVYSLLLSVMRVMIVMPLPTQWEVDAQRDGWRRYLLCGVALLVMNLVMMGVVVLTLREKGSFNYPGPLIYLMAVHAFWAVISATVKLARANRQDDPRKAAARAVSLTAAMVSMLALQTAMIERFGDGSPMFRRTMTAFVGSAVCLVELCIARAMIVKGGRMLERAA